jgi:hypothetical protein
MFVPQSGLVIEKMWIIYKAFVIALKETNIAKSVGHMAKQGMDCYK